MIDSHCHLTHDRFEADLQDVLDRARSAGVEGCVTIGTGVEDSGRALELSRDTGGFVRCTAGLDPFSAHRVADRFDQSLERLSLLLRDGGFCAVGEIGLDYHYDLDPRPVQRDRLERQLALAEDLDLPVVIHVRDAHADMAEVLAVPLIGLGLFVVAASVWAWIRANRDDASSDALEVENPLSLSVALQFGALYAAVVFIAKLLLDQFSASALNVIGAVSGINDVDAINLSMANLVNDGLSATDGASAVLLAVGVNTLFKAALVAGLGDRKALRTVIAVLGAAAAGGLVAWFII